MEIKITITKEHVLTTIIIALVIVNIYQYINNGDDVVVVGISSPKTIQASVTPQIAISGNVITVPLRATIQPADNIPVQIRVTPDTVPDVPTPIIGGFGVFTGPAVTLIPPMPTTVDNAPLPTKTLRELSRSDIVNATPYPTSSPNGMGMRREEYWNYVLRTSEKLGITSMIYNQVSLVVVVLSVIVIAYVLLTR